jgi:hypothetical protein
MQSLFIAWDKPGDSLNFNAFVFILKSELFRSFHLALPSSFVFIESNILHPASKQRRDGDPLYQY